MANTREYMSDLNHWDYADSFFGREAAYLIMGVDPSSGSATDGNSALHIIERIKNSYESAHGNYSFDMNGYDPLDSEKGSNQRRSELISVAMEEILQEARAKTDETVLNNFMFGDESEYRRQKFSRLEIHRWITENALPSTYKFMVHGQNILPQPEKQLATKELKSLYGIMLGMAIDSYSYDPQAAKSEAPRNISNDLMRHGISITDDTVRKWLRTASEAYKRST
jgi:hypothetical protein